MGTQRAGATLHMGLGDLADPIPYERLMVLEKGKYYTPFGVLYICTTDSIVGYDEDLAGLAALVTVVNEE